MLDLNMRSDCSDLKASLRCFNLQLINLVDEEEIFHDALEETPVMWSHLLSRIEHTGIEHTNTIFSIRMEENYQTRFILTFNERPFLLFSFWGNSYTHCSSLIKVRSDNRLTSRKLKRQASIREGMSLEYFHIGFKFRFPMSPCIECV